MKRCNSTEFSATGTGVVIKSVKLRVNDWNKARTSSGAIYGVVKMVGIGNENTGCDFMIQVDEYLDEGLDDYLKCPRLKKYGRTKLLFLRSCIDIHIIYAIPHPTQKSIRLHNIWLKNPLIITGLLKT